jgi:hypothetical protein
MPSETPRETAAIVQLFQQAHNKIVALRRLDDQIAAMVLQHVVLQQDVRAIQARINEEFERVIKFNQAPGKIPARFTEPLLPGEPPAEPHANGQASANGNGQAKSPPPPAPPTPEPIPVAEDEADDDDAVAPRGEDAEPITVEPAEPLRVPIRRSVPAPSLTGPILENPPRSAAGFPS